jgi:hypothetical protein
MTVRIAAVSEPPSIDPAMGFASFRVCGHHLWMHCYRLEPDSIISPRLTASGPYPFMDLRRLEKCPDQRSSGFFHKSPNLQRFNETNAWPAR